MKDMKNLIYIFSCASLLLFQSCRPSKPERMERLLNQWHGKEIQFPKDAKVLQPFLPRPRLSPKEGGITSKGNQYF